MRLPFSKRDQEAKSLDVLPEGLWQSFVNQGDQMGTTGLESAVGVPAVLAVIRLIAHTTAMVPLPVVSGGRGDVLNREEGTWQWQLLNRAPGLPPATPFSFKADYAANFHGRGQAFIRKGKPANVSPGRPRIIDLEVLDSSLTLAKRASNGQVVFEDANGVTPVDRGTDEVIQVRSFAIGNNRVGIGSHDRLNGQSPISACRNMVTAALSRGQFEAKHFENGIFPGMAAKFPAGVSLEQGQKWIEFLKAQHQGSAKAGKLVGIGGGADLVPLPISLVDAQFAEVVKLTMEQAAALWQVPMALALQTRQAATDDDYRHFMTFAVGPGLVALCEALTADRDFFDPRDEGDMRMRVIPDVDAPLKFDPLKKAQVQREQIQTGTRLVDELRAEDGLAALPAIPKDWTERPGQVPQITPVGGKPNPTVDTAAANPATAEPDA